MHQGAYLTTAGENYPFDYLTLTLWLTRFSVCPLTLEKIDPEKLEEKTISYPANEHVPTALMGLYKQMYGYEFANYQDFSKYIAHQYNENKANLRTAEKSLEELPALLLLIALIFMAYSISLIPLFHTIALTLMLTFLSARRVLIWCLPGYFSTDDQRSQADGWIRQECKALVLLWQSQRAADSYADLTQFSPKVRITLETMRRSLADVYLSIFKGKHLGLNAQGMRELPWPVHKETWPGLMNALRYLYRLGAPRLEMPERTASTPSSAFQERVPMRRASDESHPTALEAAPSNQPRSQR